MILPQQRRIKYIRLFLIVASPALLYLGALINATVPFNVLWLPLYLLGVVPYLIINVLYTIAAQGEINDIGYLLMILLQLVFAHTIAHVSAYRPRGAPSDIGTFRTEDTKEGGKRLRLFLSIYLIVFIMYSLYFLYTSFMA